MRPTITLKDLYCKMTGLDDKTFRKLRRHLSYFNGYFASVAAAEYGGDGSTYMMTPKGTFLLGLAGDVHQWLVDKGIEHDIEDLRTKIVKPTSKDIKEVLKQLPFKPRPYQRELILRGCVKTHGLIHAATGAGKTFVMAAILASWNKPTLIIVNSKDLMYQLQFEISEYLGYDADYIGIIGDSIYAPKTITIGMVQSLRNSRLGASKKKLVKDTMLGAEVLFCDEVHHAQAKTYRETIKGCKNAIVRLGFSATPTTSEIQDVTGEILRSDIVLKAYFGPVLGRVTTRDLIEKGFLAEPTVVMIENFLYFDGVKLEYAKEYDRIVSKDDDRNMTIASVIAHHYNEGSSVIGFVTRIEHGEIVARLLEDEFRIPAEEIGYVTGELDVSTRGEHIRDFKEGSMRILMGTVLSEGLNFLPDVGINISGGKADKTAIQRIGRVLRKKRDPVLKDVNTEEHRSVLYYDFMDLGHPVFESHSKKREDVYKREGHRVRKITEEQLREKFGSEEDV